MSQIKYVGPFLSVEADGVKFTRHIFVDVPDSVAKKLLTAKLPGAESKNAFVAKQDEHAAVTPKTQKAHVAANAA